jgi:hypothetical protein
VHKPEKILLIIHRNDGHVQRVQRKQVNRISAVLRWINELEVNKYLVRVTYSTTVDNFGNAFNPINEGEYLSKADLLYALRCFTE